LIPAHATLPKPWGLTSQKWTEESVSVEELTVTVPTISSMSVDRVVIVGGGVIGLACAYYLRREGIEVTILDSRTIGSGCSHGNCGYVSPSHILPLTERGAVGVALKSLFRKDAPFRVKPRLDPVLWLWLLRFALRCNVPSMLQAATARHALLSSSRALYTDLIESEGLECEWQQRGLYLVFGTEAAFRKYAETDRMLRDRFGTAAEHIGAKEMLKREPALRETIAGAWHYSGDAHLRPDRLLASWRRLLERRGVNIREDCMFEGFVGKGGNAAAVTTSAGKLRGDAFIIATGAWTPKLNSELGCRVPIQPGKGYSITMPHPTQTPSTPLIFAEERVAVTPMQSAYRLGSTMEFAGYDTQMNVERIEMIKRVAAQYLRYPYTEEVQEEWYGWRPMTFDGVPFIDHTPRFSNVVVAAGHNMLGLSMATATGKLVSEIVLGKEPHIDPGPYKLSRV
jgi:D-amino-acid dehydrogenase